MSGKQKRAAPDAPRSQKSCAAPGEKIGHEDHGLNITTAFCVDVELLLSDFCQDKLAG